MKNLDTLCMGCMNQKGSDFICPHCGYNPSVPPSPFVLAPGSVLSKKYLIGNVIDTNGEGITYIGYDLINDVVLRIREYFPAGLCERSKNGEVKIIPGFEYNFNDGIIKFLELSKTLYRLSDVSALLTIIDIHEENKTAYRISESVQGISLREFLLRNGGTLTWEQARPLFISLVSSLQTLHEAGIVHRGLSPETLLIGKDGKLRIVGFCIAEARTAHSFMTAQLFPGYAATEQYGSLEKDGVWTDVFGFGAVLYRTLVGASPIEATERIENDTLSIPARVAPSVPQNIVSLLSKSLELLPSDRLASMDDVREIIVSTKPTSPEKDSNKKGKQKRSVSKKKKSTKSSKKYAFVAATITCVLLAAVCIPLFIILSPDNNENSLSSDPSSSVPEMPSSSIVSSATSDTTKYISVPDFSNKTFSDIIVSYGETYDFQIVSKVYSDKTEGVVTSQNPVGNTNIEKSDQKPKIELTISLGSNQKTIPNVYGKSETDAIFELMKTGFSYKSITVTPIYDATSTPKSVIRCEPEVGKKANIDSGVEIYVNSYAGEPPVSSNQETASN